ncbi:MAG: hypothetical protein Q7S92_04890 [Candidatus Diapherotrites archaeon]|nr:hypothetical protein [Candidatus Diapherotrites archaeon]
MLKRKLFKVRPIAVQSARHNTRRLGLNPKLRGNSRGTLSFDEAILRDISLRRLATAGQHSLSGLVNQFGLTAGGVLSRIELSQRTELLRATARLEKISVPKLAKLFRLSPKHVRELLNPSTAKKNSKKKSANLNGRHNFKGRIVRAFLNDLHSGNFSDAELMTKYENAGLTSNKFEELTGRRVNL